MGFNEDLNYENIDQILADSLCSVTIKISERGFHLHF